MPPAFTLQFSTGVTGELKVKTFNIRLSLTRATLILASLTVMGMFQNCSKATFSQATGGSGGTLGGGGGLGGIDGTYRDHLDQPNTTPGSCYTILHNISTDVKLLFVVDTSGSNAGANGTDPNRSVRSGSIQAFFNDYQSKQNFYWGFNNFAGTTSQSLITGPANSPYFSNMISAMQGAITQFNGIQDAGNTPYQAAFDLAKQAIQSDTNVTASTKWIVVWMSDGLPNPTVPDSALVAGVQSVVNLHPGAITFNTIYYGQNDVEATARLKLMAQKGGGYFLNTNANPSGKDFLISNVINVPGTKCTM
jgi:hypothetical protein